MLIILSPRIGKLINNFELGVLPSSSEVSMEPSAKETRLLFFIVTKNVFTKSLLMCFL